GAGGADHRPAPRCRRRRGLPGPRPTHRRPGDGRDPARGRRPALRPGGVRRLPGRPGRPRHQVAPAADPGHRRPADDRDQQGRQAGAAAYALGLTRPGVGVGAGARRGGVLRRAGRRPAGRAHRGARAARAGAPAGPLISRGHPSCHRALQIVWSCKARGDGGPLMAQHAGETIANSTVPHGSTERWRDPKRYLWLIGLVVPSLAFIAFGMYSWTGSGLWFWIGPVVILIVVPAIDLVAGLDRSNPPDDMIEALENDRYYRWITYLYLPIQYAGFVAAAWLFVDGDLGWFAKIGLAISIGCIGGIGINTAHELGHKKESHERWLSKIALAQSFYGHFYIEHNRGHHVRVATPEDPASSRLGETFYAFWPRTVWGSLKSAWNLEKKRYARRKQH